MLVLTCLGSLPIAIDTYMMKQTHSLFIIKSIAILVIRKIKSNKTFLRNDNLLKWKKFKVNRYGKN